MSDVASKSAQPSVDQPVCVHLGRYLLGPDYKPFYLCKNPRRERMCWSARLQPHAFSIADAIALAPLVELNVKQFPLPSSYASSDWGELHKKTIRSGVFVVGVEGGKHILYNEFLAAASGQNLPNNWFSHGVPSLCVQ